MNRSKINLQKKTINFLSLVAVMVLVVPAGIYAQSGSEKRPVTHDDYDSWKSIRSQQISSNGRWIAYQIQPRDGEGELVIRSTRDETEYRFDRGSQAGFTRDTAYIIFLVSPSEDSLDAAKADGRKGPNLPQNQMVIMSLSDGSTTIIERVRNFRQPAEASGWLAYLKPEPPAEEEPEEGTEETEERPAGGRTGGGGRPGQAGRSGRGGGDDEKDFGTELVLRSLEDGTETTHESVLSYQFTENGEWLLYIVSSEDSSGTDGVYGHRIGETESSPVLSGEGNYKRWVLNDEETHLAFLTDRDEYESNPRTFNLYGWSIGEPEAQLWVSHSSTSGFPAGMSVSDLSGLSFTDDGSMILLGIKDFPEPREEESEEGDEEAAEAEEEEEEETATFELWHWNDPYPYPYQKLQADRIRNETYESVYHVGSGRFVQLADEELTNVSLSDDGSIAFGQTNQPYVKQISYDSSYYDVYVLDPETGTRTLVVKENYFRASLSPNAKYVYWFGTDRHWHVYDIAAKTTANITYDVPVDFWQRNADRPQPPGGYRGMWWTDGDATVLVRDEFDIWEIQPDGSGARNITEGFGRANNLAFSYYTFDRDVETINPRDWMLLRTTNTETMASGFYRDRVRGNREPQQLHMADYSYGISGKADDANAVLMTRQTFFEFPDLWLTSTSFKDFQKLTDVGAQRDEFIWGNSELVNYYNADGVELKGILTKPENFDPGKKYPMLVYIYEKLTNGLHRFTNPSSGSSINASYYVSNGYIIWEPDINYGTGHPGPDALNCVVPSVETIIDMGFVDPERVGLQGHSWGGYQGAYMITQTDIFAAIESGAPVSNMTSAYGGIRWASGVVRQMQYERTQSRLGRTLWNGGMMRYIENSPIFFADNINTPVLILHNDEDGAVPWYQGIELIMALRRLGKVAFMFNYNGEAHGLRRRPNMKDYTIRMQEFFDHYLKGKPAPDWMINGIQAWEKEK